jgi:surface antigen
MRKAFLAATAVALVFGATAQAQPYDGSSGPDPYGYYSRYDHQGYYDRSGRYIRFDDRRDYRDGGDDEDSGPPPDGRYYREGAYEDNCRKNNNVAGTIFGALAGGLIGGAASHGNGGAVVGGVVLGGLLGNALTRDMPCEDHPYAMHVYAEGLDGDIGRRYEWRHGDDYGYFTPEREFNRGGYMCRSWSETTYARGRSYTRSGTACRQRDGNWHFDD